MRAQVGRGACVQVSRGRGSRGAGWPPEDGLSEMLRSPVVGRSRRSRGGAEPGGCFLGRVGRFLPRCPA